MDVHSHLLPGLDDGVQDIGLSMELIRYFQSLGYRKLITSPHVMSDTYRNTTADILGKLEEVRQHIRQQNIAMEIDAVAEYYLDEALIKTIESKEQLLTFGKNYLLFETNFIVEPLNLKEFIFLAITSGYTPVMAHPERYLYIQDNIEKAEDLLNRGVLFQVNASSITGHYSRRAQVIAQKLIDKGWIHLLGSDCHSLQHVKLLEQAQQMKYFQKALSLPLLNNSL
ncbi:MAG TPA: CpsB/CapC family capsule biosynthesis tyrosine phosphatase [Ohtaekwangia sp.]